MDYLKRVNPLKRVLHLFFKEWKNRKEIQRAIVEVNPDIIFVWNLGTLSLSMLKIMAESKIPVVFSVADFWLQQYRNDDWLVLLRKLGIPHKEVLPVVPKNILFISNNLMEQTKKTVEIQNSEVVYWGVDPMEFPYMVNKRTGKKILYVGQVVEHKGVHLAIDAIHELKKMNSVFENIVLTIGGGTTKPDYLETLRSKVRELGLEQNVNFLGPVARHQLLEIFQEHNIQIFPSLWEEPLGLAMLEGMAMGLPIVATGTGGSGEALIHGESALIYQKDSALDCAKAIARLIEDESIFETIRKGGRMLVEKTFNVERMTDLSEKALLKAITSK